MKSSKNSDVCGNSRTPQSVLSRAGYKLRNFFSPHSILSFIIDLVLISCALYLALALRFESVWTYNFSEMFRHLPKILCIYALFLILGRFYSVLWRYAGVWEVVRLALLCAGAGVVCVLLNTVFVWNASRSALVIHAIISVVLIGLSRIGWRMISRRRVMNRNRSEDDVERVARPRLMIVGAGMAGSCVMNLCSSDPSLGTPVVFVDDAKHKQGLMIRGVPVAGTSKDIPELVSVYRISDIMVAIPSLRGEALSQLVSACTETGCRVRISGFSQNPNEVACLPENLVVREPNISDFLARDEVVLDTAGISDYLTGRTVFVSGGGGSIGAELCRQIIKFSPKLLIIFDVYENCAYELLCELKQLYGADCPALVLIGSIRDRTRLDELMLAYRPEVVFHAAAHKHVPLMEDSPAEAVKNNVFGTLNLLESASAHGVQRFVTLSTDKAVNPTNVMGTTKRITEMLIQYYAHCSSMKCMAVRFGNVLGSHGSVIPLFERQIKTGGPVTVTHPDINRYFMTIAEAAQLVLQAGAIAISGAIFVLDMGQPVRIMELAEQMIRFYGYEPGNTMRIEITGLRPGEKLYEELLTDRERDKMRRTSHEQIMIAPPVEQDAQQFEMQLEVLQAACARNDARVIEVLHTVVPEFVRSEPLPVQKPESEQSKAQLDVG